jgi:hypothetical protein
MSTLETIALASAAAWMAMLSLVVLLLVRQIGILTVRLERDEQPPEQAYGGIEIGRAIPTTVADALPALNGAPTYVVLVDASCPPCRELAADLERPAAAGRVIVALTGPDQLSTAFCDLLPNGIEVVRDPEASVVHEGLSVSTTPFVVEVTGDTVTGKAAVRGGPHLLAFMTKPDAPGVVREQPPPTLEVVTHGD